MQKKHILFSVAGMTPQIITETLFGLWKQQPSAIGGEIHILTTSQGRKSLLELSQANSPIEAFNKAYQTQWQICPEWIEVIQDAAGNELADLRTADDNEQAANQIVRRVHHWTQQAGVILHASVAGGRKTMGLFLSQAMSWYARPEDDLSHVLADGAFESSRQYFPQPDNPAHAAVLDFASLPFVRMNGLLPMLLAEQDSYADKVRLSQLCLDDVVLANGELTLNLQTHELFLEGHRLLVLSPMSTVLYLFLLEYANLARGQDKFSFSEAFSYRQAFHACLGKVKGIRCRTVGLSSLLNENEAEWHRNWLNESDYQELRASDLHSGFSRLAKDLKGLWLNDNASFRLQGAVSNKKIDNARWVDIDPQRIQIIGSKQ